MQPPKGPNDRSKRNRLAALEEILKHPASYTAAIAAYSAEQRRKTNTPVSGKIVSVALYPQKASEPCWLLEVQLEGVGPGLDFGGFTQAIPGVPEQVWQTAWQEVVLDADGKRVVANASDIGAKPERLRGHLRIAFFMHHLDLNRPLMSQLGPVSLPRPTPKPKRLEILKYEPPD